MKIIVIPQNEDVPCARWASWSGALPAEAHLYFNQMSAADLDASIPYIVGLGRKLKEQRPQIAPSWSVPFPGSLEQGSVASGFYDALYRKLFEQVLAIYDPKSTGRIKVRLPWEFNLDGGRDAAGRSNGQTNTAKDWSGRFNAPLYVLAYRRIAEIARDVSPRFWLSWVPNHGRQKIAAFEPYYPGDDVVDEVGFDFYFWSTNWAGENAAHAIDASGFGFQWLVDFARAHRKPWCIAELGADSDHFAPELRKLLAWAQTQGCRWVGWWDRYEVINTRVSTGALPEIGAVVREFLA